MSSGKLTQQQRQILLVVLIPVFMSLLSVSIVNVVLPGIGRDLDAPSSALQWVLSGYTLSFGVLLVAAGRAGDVYGRGRLFVIGSILFGAASLLAGLAPNDIVLNIARVLMGFGSGLLNPQTVGIIQQYFSGPERGRAFGYFGSTVGISVAIGPVLGGVFMAAFGDGWGWRASFLINVPFALIGAFAAFRLFPASAWTSAADTAETDGRGKSRADMDPVGTVLFALAILLIMLPFMERALGAWVFSLVFVGIALIGVWVAWEKHYKARGREPMVDLSLFRIPSFANGSLLIGLYFMGTTSIWVVSAVFLQGGHDFTALQAGLIGLPGALGTIGTSAWAGRKVFAYGRHLVLWGMVIAIVCVAGSIGVVLLAQAGLVSIWWLMLPLSVLGTAQGIIVSPNQTLTLLEVPVRDSGAAGGVLQTGQRVGTAVGIAAITGTLFAVQATAGWDAAFITAFTVIGVIMSPAAAVAVWDVIVSGRRGGSQPPGRQTVSSS